MFGYTWLATIGRHPARRRLLLGILLLAGLAAWWFLRTRLGARGYSE